MFVKVSTSWASFQRITSVFTVSTDSFNDRRIKCNYKAHAALSFKKLRSSSEKTLRALTCSLCLGVCYGCANEFNVIKKQKEKKKQWVMIGCKSENRIIWGPKYNIKLRKKKKKKPSKGKQYSWCSREGRERCQSIEMLQSWCQLYVRNSSLLFWRMTPGLVLHYKLVKDSDKELFNWSAWNNIYCQHAYCYLKSI